MRDDDYDFEAIEREEAAEKQRRQAHPDIGQRPSRKIMRDEMLKRIAEATIQPPPSVEAVLNALLQQYVNYALDKAAADHIDIDDDDIRHHEESRAVSALYKGLKDYKAFLEDNYHDWLWHRERKIPKWMEGDKIIKGILHNTKFWDVLQALLKHSKPKDGEENVQRASIYFIGNAEFYGTVAAQLKMSVVTVRHYVQAFWRVGVIQQMDKKKMALKGNTFAYQVGYVQIYKDGKKQTPLLKKALRNKIRKFRLPSNKDSKVIG